MTSRAAARDPGLQPERTALAWKRTGLAVFGNALLLLRSGVDHASLAVTADGLALLAAAAWLVVQGTRRRADLALDSALAAPPPYLLRQTMVVRSLVCITSANVILAEAFSA